MELTWDDLKEVDNIGKHGIDFEEALTVVLNPLSLYCLKPMKVVQDLSI